MASSSLPRREPAGADVIDLRPFDAPATVSSANLDTVLTWLDEAAD